MLTKSLWIAVLMGLLMGCASIGVERRDTSSLVAFLYPKGQQQKLTEQQVVNLRLPVKVGIVFVPSNDVYRQGVNGYVGSLSGSSLNMADQITLLNEVAQHFRKYPYVKTVEVIPSAYLIPGGGFDNLDALASMYDVDIIALVSYDQVQNTDEGALSLLYWTIVGAYVVPAEKNTTTTFVDTAVFDVNSHKLLFRAPGISRSNGSGTLINNTQSLRAESRQGFQAAFTQMIDNLDKSLATFKQKVKDQPNEYHVSAASGYQGGGGNVGVITLLLLALVWFVRRGWIRLGNIPRCGPRTFMRSMKANRRLESDEH